MFLLLAIVLVAAGSPPEAAAKGSQPVSPDLTRGHMAAFEATWQALQVHVASQRAFSDPANAATVRAALAALTTSATALAHSNRAREPLFAVSSRVLELHLTRALDTFDDDRPEAARRLVQATSRACIACHGQRRAESGRPLFASMDDVENPFERADALFATRRFDEAAEVYRALVTSHLWVGAVSQARRLELERALSRYLLVQVRVRGDLAQAREVLALAADRAGLPEVLAERVRAWSAALSDPSLLPRFDLTKAAPAKVLAWAAPRCGPEIGRGGPAWGLDQSVPMLLASSALYGSLAAHPYAKEAPAALVALARCEVRLGRTLEVPIGDLLLEECVYLAPHSAQAWRCYTELEHYLLRERARRPTNADRERLGVLRGVAD